MQPLARGGPSVGAQPQLAEPFDHATDRGLVPGAVGLPGVHGDADALLLPQGQRFGGTEHAVGVDGVGGPCHGADSIRTPSPRARAQVPATSHPLRTVRSGALLRASPPTLPRASLQWKSTRVT